MRGFLDQVTGAARAPTESGADQAALTVDHMPRVDGLFMAEDERDRGNPMLFPDTLEKHVRVLSDLQLHFMLCLLHISVLSQ